MKKSKKKLPSDANKLAYEIVRMSTEDFEEVLCGPQPKIKKPIKPEKKGEK